MERLTLVKGTNGNVFYDHELGAFIGISSFAVEMANKFNNFMANYKSSPAAAKEEFSAIGLYYPEASGSNTDAFYKSLSNIMHASCNE